MKIYVPTPLRSYTGQKGWVDGEGCTLGEVLSDLDRRYPGLRLRIINEQDDIREHIKIFINQRQARDLTAPHRSSDEVHVISALSGA